MSIMVKDVNGTEQAVASNGKANAGLTLGIIGTDLLISRIFSFRFVI